MAALSESGFFEQTVGAGRDLALGFAAEVPFPIFYLHSGSLGCMSHA